MDVPIVAGQPAHLWLGLLLLLMLTFQLGTGKRWIKVPFTYHRKNAGAMALVAALHAFWGAGHLVFKFPDRPVRKQGRERFSTKPWRRYAV